jgi:hypothetical protein
LHAINNFDVVAAPLRNHLNADSVEFRSLI